MWLDELWSLFEGEVFNRPSSWDGRKRLFNLYKMSDPTLDLAVAPGIRQRNLRSYLESLPERPKVLLVGEAPGWRGCRFSGVPFTSEAQLCTGKLPFSGRQSSRGPVPLNEISAQVFWEALLHRQREFFAWNSLPLHPSGTESCSNRLPTLAETRQFLPLLVELYAILQPERVVGIGRRACWTLGQAGIEAVYVRHPAHGGAAEFRKGIKMAFSDPGRQNPPMHPPVGKV